MEENILRKIVENDNVYYLVKLKESKIYRKIARIELIKRNKKLCEDYESKHRNIESFINKKRKKSDSNGDNKSKDISSEETQRIHSSNKTKVNKKFGPNPKNKSNPFQIYFKW